MKTSDLLFIGIKGSVVALHRDSGQQIWSIHLEGSDFVNVLVEGDVVVATTSGEVFQLDALSGNSLWHNPLKGFGLGLASIATAGSPAGNNALAMSEKRRRDEQAAAASAHTTTT